MSHSSWSRSKGHYPAKDHGGHYYKKTHHSGGILGKIFEVLTGSKGHSRSYSKHGNGYYPNRHRRKSSWS